MNYRDLSEVEKAAYHLLWVWVTYGDVSRRDGEIYLHHKDMSAGEGAGEFLQDLGLVDCDGYSDAVTEKGKALMAAEMGREGSV